jgi:malate dehydrogenase
MDESRRCVHLVSPTLTIDVFDPNARIVDALTKEIAKTCPNAFILVITNPVNSIVPLIAEILKSENKFNPRKLFGVTTLDVMRASTFAAQAIKLPPEDIVVPVVGGHSRKTIVPLFSQSKPALNLGKTELKSLVEKVQCGGDEVQQAKAGAGTATLSMACVAYRWKFNFYANLDSRNPC